MLVDRGGFALQRIEAGRFALRQAQVAATTGTHEQLGAAILVEEEDGWPGLVFLYLRQQEVDQRSLAGAGLADDQRVGERFFADAVFAGMGGVEVEVIGLAIGRLQHGDTFAPGVVAALAGGEVVQRAQAEEIQR